MIATSLWSADGKLISAEEFLHNIYGTLQDFFKNEDELREIWSKPVTRKTFLDKLFKYYSINDAVEYLGGVEKIQNTFIAFQKYLYDIQVA